MVLHLYSTGPVVGRCAVLAHLLGEVQQGKGSVIMAERLFAGKCTQDNPAILAVSNRAAVTSLKNACVEYGIVIEIITDV